MDIFKEETEFNVTHIPMFQRVVDMFDGRPGIQRIVRLGLLANMDYSDELDVADEDDWLHHPSNSYEYPRPSLGSDRGLGENHTKSSSSVYQLPRHHYTAGYDPPCPSSVKVQAKESDTERRARLLQEAKKSKEKAEKKKLKKEKQKERKLLEKLEKEKQNPVKNEEENDDAQKSKAEESKPVKNKSTSSVKELASANITDSSGEDESSDEGSNAKDDSCDSEELDMTSTFVSKAALIARRKLDQKSRPERKEKKKIPVKETKTVPDMPNEDLEFEKKESAASSNPTFEDNIKISTDLATMGNKFASSGDFNTAVKYFTDAIKYNPTEFKLFGNRSFCFEKMQEYMKALTDAELSLSMCPGWVKGLFRKGRALAGLKRYEEAAQAFSEVLKLDSSYAEAAQELMRMQIIQLMEYGYTREQSSNALIIHGTVKKAVEVLSKLHHQPGAFQNGLLPLAQVANASGVSPVLSASTSPAPPQPQDAPKTTLQNKPLGPVQNMSNVKSQPKPFPNQAMKAASENNHPPQELFPVWVGNLVYPVPETVITKLFSKVGVVYSVKVLTYKRCAFINFTKQEDCEEAIRHFSGFELNGNKLVVRYPDRIPHGMGISKSALKAAHLQDENVGQNNYIDGRNAGGNRRPVRPYRPVPDYRGNHKQ
ncbi:tetratricopeptide repeat protein 31-like isoform X2 [Chelmon rostratus]|uniref:tetratricopeptide repeat protein 31-like isoform X2 n=1 Tax=Chelmon rostratus TaxID=109905 RepID=UPI001BE8C337|nr:tetratricopeptide repeat protein 31-like isoform X2 [Chelmon rostratus]